MEGRSKIRTLFVGADRERYELLIALLERRGHTITFADTAEEALGIWLSDPLPLLITPMALPGLSGLELCERVRRQHGGERAVVLVLTEQHDPSLLYQGLDVGVSDFLDRALPPSQLEVRVAVAEKQVWERDRRARVEAALRRQEEAFRGVIEAIPDGVLIHRHGNIVFANPALAVTLGFEDAAEMVDMEVMSLVLPIERARALTWISGAQDAAPTADLRLVDGAGQLLTVEVTRAQRVRFDGERAWLLLLRDVTQKRQSRARLAVAERMATVGTLAAGVAHGINNPLAYMIGNLTCAGEDLAALRDGEPDVDRRRAMLDELIKMNSETRDGAERVRVLVRDLKAFSALRDNQVEAVDLEEVLEATLQLAGQELKFRAVVERQYKRPPKVSGNKGHLSQIALNLLINAARALPVGNTADNRIVVRTDFLETGMVRMDIEDTGCGMSPEVVDHVFDPFFTTRSMTEGVGMGLAICHGLIVGMGGRIELDSQLGRGTRVSVILPPAPVGEWEPTPIAIAAPDELPAPTPPTVEPPRADGDPLRVLVVDDEPAIGRMLIRELSPHNVVYAESGRQALELYSAKGFDLIFCDLMMPEVSGMDFYDQLRSRRPGAEARIVFMTGGAFTRRAKTFLDTVKNPWLEKPFAPEKLNDVLRQMTSTTPA